MITCVLSVLLAERRLGEGTAVHATRTGAKGRPRTGAGRNAVADLLVVSAGAAQGMDSGLCPSATCCASMATCEEDWKSFSRVQKGPEQPRSNSMPGALG